MGVRRATAAVFRRYLFKAVEESYDSAVVVYIEAPLPRRLTKPHSNGPADF